MTENAVKHATPDHDILEPLVRRYSPYVFEPKPVERAKLLSCLEAARWSASSFNEQPWSFIVATREDAGEFQRMIECLMEANQAWAKDAGVVMITVVCKTFTKNGKPNRVAEHDVGLAMGNFTVQAMTLGLHVHQMAGVNLTKARQTYNIPDTHEPFTGVALGYAGDPHQAENQDLRQRDLAPRSRKPLADIVFAGAWQKPAAFVTGG